MIKILNICIFNKVATYLRREGSIICGNADYKINFTFDSDWDGIEQKVARFIWKGEYFDQEFTGNECPVPTLDHTDELLVGVYAGTIQEPETLKTTTSARIPCKRSVLCATSTPSDNEYSKHKDLYEEAVNMAAETKALRNDLQTAVWDAQGAASVAERYAENASNALQEMRQIYNAADGTLLEMRQIYASAADALQEMRQIYVEANGTLQVLTQDVGMLSSQVNTLASALDNIANRVLALETKLGV